MNFETNKTVRPLFLYSLENVEYKFNSISGLSIRFHIIHTEQYLFKQAQLEN